MSPALATCPSPSALPHSGAGSVVPPTRVEGREQVLVAGGLVVVTSPTGHAGGDPGGRADGWSQKERLLVLSWVRCQPEDVRAAVSPSSRGRGTDTGFGGALRPQPWATPGKVRSKGLSLSQSSRLPTSARGHLGGLELGVPALGRLPGRSVGWGLRGEAITTSPH